MRGNLRRAMLLRSVVIPSEHTTNSIAHMSTANRMLAIVQQPDVMNNAHGLNGPFHDSKRRGTLHSNKRVGPTRLLRLRPILRPALRTADLRAGPRDSM